MNTLFPACGALVALLLRNCLRVLRGVRAGLDPAVCGPDSPRKGVDDTLSLCG